MVISTLINSEKYGYHTTKTEGREKMSKKYVVKVYGPIYKDQIGCVEVSDALTGNVISTTPYTKKVLHSQNVKRNLFKMVWEVMFDVIYDEKKFTEIIKILSEQGVTMLMEDNVNGPMKKLF